MEDLMKPLEERKSSLIDCAHLLAHLAPEHPDLVKVIDQKLFFAREAIRHAAQPNYSLLRVKRVSLRRFT